MLWIALVVAFVLVAAFVGVVLAQPAGFRISRSASIATPPSKIFDQVNDFHNWKEWSPWDELDPNLKRTYGGPPSGEGATYSWEGNKKVGKGTMTILESLPPEWISIKLDFEKPIEATNTAEFSFQPEGERTRVEWSMTGENKTFMTKAFGMVMNLDKMVGKDFEKGLASLEATVRRR